MLDKISDSLVASLCEEFHKLEHQLQIDSLHNFLLQCASRISEPTEAIESDPQDNEKTPFSLDE